MATLLIQGFQQSHYGCYLWVSGVLIREYGDEYTSEDIKDAVYRFGMEQCSYFFNLLFNTNEEGVRAMSDVVEDYFRMMNDLLMFYPFKVIANQDLLKSTLKASLLTLNLINEFNPIISCIHFLVDLVSWGLPSPPISFFDESDLTIPRHGMQQFLVSENNGGAVSYTHLDVYKRQLYVYVLHIHKIVWMQPALRHNTCMWAKVVCTGLVWILQLK